MGRFNLATSLALAAFAVGCAESPTAVASGAVFIAVAGPIEAGSLGSAELVNRSGSAVRIGMISCLLGMDHFGPAGWTAVPQESGACPQPEFIVLSGESYSFEFQAPESAGTFRIHTFVEGDAVFSKPFIVR